MCAMFGVLILRLDWRAASDHAIQLTLVDKRRDPVASTAAADYDQSVGRGDRDCPADHDSDDLDDDDDKQVLLR